MNTEEIDMQTMIFRYSVLVDVFNSRLPDDMKSARRLSEETKKKLLKVPYSKQNDRLVLLFGMEIIDEETLKNTILFNSSDWLEYAVALETRVRSDEEREIKSDYEALTAVFKVCANSRQCPEITGVDFNTAEQILKSPHTAEVNGFIHTDKEIMKFMFNAGIPFASFDNEENSIHCEDDSFISQAAEDESYDMKLSESYFPLDYAALDGCLAVYGKTYAEDYVIYARENQIPFKSFKQEYDNYLNNVKLCFEVKAYSKKRKICGENTVNYFDYSHNVMEQGMLIKSSLEADDVYSAKVFLDTKEPLSEDELETRAMSKYIKSHQPLENMVIEVYHCKKIHLYIYRANNLVRFTEKEEKIFRSQLFDFNELWSVIKECSDSGKLRRSSDTIYMSTEFVERIRPEWQIYAQNIIEDQFGRRKRNMIAAKLNDLRNAAKSALTGGNGDEDSNNGNSKRKKNKFPKLGGN